MIFVDFILHWTSTENITSLVFMIVTMEIAGNLAF